MRGFVLLEEEKLKTLIETGYIVGDFRAQIGCLVKQDQNNPVPLNYHNGTVTTIRMLKTQNILNQMKWFNKRLIEMEIPVTDTFSSADDAITSNLDCAMSGNNDYFVRCTRLDSREVVSVISGVENGFQFDITINVLDYDKCPSFLNDIIIGPAGRLMIHKSDGTNVGLNDSALRELRPHKCMSYNTLYAVVNYLVNSDAAEEILECLNCKKGRVPNTYWSKSLAELMNNQDIKVFS